MATVKQASFDTLWQLKAGFLASPADVKDRTKKESSRETIFQKRPMPEQEGDTSQGKDARMAKRAKKSGTTNKSNESETIPRRIMLTLSGVLPPALPAFSVSVGNPLRCSCTGPIPTPFSERPLPPSSTPGTLTLPGCPLRPPLD